MKGKKIGILIGVSAVVVAVGASVTVTQQNEYKLIRQFGKVDSIKIIPRHSHKILFKTTVLFIPSFSTLHLYLPFSSNLKLNQCNNTYQ